MSKIQERHQTKQAYIYLRQSTMGQVRLNQESTQRQYALKDKALQLGWASNMIRVLDRDLGFSGAELTKREDFKLLVADVSMNKVGAVFALEASRLSRSSTDWHRLLELCSLTGTLIIDEDGCYNPTDFNDQLLLGLKGTMSQAELHFIRARLQGGKLNKAKKGELRLPLPVGFCFDEEGNTVLDPDEEVRGAVQLLFDKFTELGSAYGVLCYFAHHQMKFPKRTYGGIWKGKLTWGTLTNGRVLELFKNPTYAGAYVFGRYKNRKELSDNGEIQYRLERLPMGDWQVMIKNHHEGYISWERYLENQNILAKNRTNTVENMLPGPVREGLTLLQGLLICAICGHRLSVRYKGNKGIYPTYHCNWKMRDALSSKRCMSFRSDIFDEAVSNRVLEIIQPAQLKIAIEATYELERRQEATDKQWQMKIERANYEAQLRQRRYEEVDPSNRLVATTLEKNWNDALINLDEVKSQYAEYQAKEALAVTKKQKHSILSLSKDLPRLWRASTTKAKDRKRILRLLIKDITVEKPDETGRITLNIRWQGGSTESLKVMRPQKTWEKWRTSPEIIERVKSMVGQFNDRQIAATLNKEGMKSSKGNAFTADSICQIRHKYLQFNKPAGALTVREVSVKFGVSHHVVYYWIARNIISSSRINGSNHWITIDKQKETELYELVKSSTRIPKSKTFQQQIEGGAL